MNRVENESDLKKEAAPIILLAALLGLNVAATCSISFKIREGRERCITTGQIDDNGKRLDGFKGNQECEKFLPGNYPIPPGYGMRIGW